MAKIAWLGEPTAEDDGPRQNIWNGITFPRGVEVDVTNTHMIAKARRNPSFSVDGEVYVPPGGNAQAGHQSGVPGPRIADKTQLSEMTVAELREQAAARNIDVTGMTKAEIREKLSEQA
jgi:hypothetical protein